jgi:hypothetical protein
MEGLIGCAPQPSPGTPFDHVLRFVLLCPFLSLEYLSRGQEYGFHPTTIHRLIGSMANLLGFRIPTLGLRLC